jgi:hypothetical protein
VPSWKFREHSIKLFVPSRKFMEHSNNSLCPLGSSWSIQATLCALLEVHRAFKYIIFAKKKMECTGFVQHAIAAI